MELMQLLWITLCAFIMAGCISALVIIWGCVLHGHDEATGSDADTEARAPRGSWSGMI